MMKIKEMSFGSTFLGNTLVVTEGWGLNAINVNAEIFESNVKNENMNAEIGLRALQG